MFGLSPKEAFCLGIAALWLYSSAVGAMDEPTAASSGFYRWLYKFLKSISGDLASVFGKYLPGSPNYTPPTPPTATPKTLAMVLLAAALVAPMLGCVHAANTPLPKGAVNSADAETNAILQAGWAAANRYEQDVKGGFQPAPTLKSAAAALVNALNTADPIYQVWHAQLVTDAAAPEPATLPAAVAQVSSALTSVTQAGK